MSIVLTSSELQGRISAFGSRLSGIAKLIVQTENELQRRLADPDEAMWEAIVDAEAIRAEIQDLWFLLSADIAALNVEDMYFEWKAGVGEIVEFAISSRVITAKDQYGATVVNAFSNLVAGDKLDLSGLTLSAEDGLFTVAVTPGNTVEVTEAITDDASETALVIRFVRR